MSDEIWITVDEKYIRSSADSWMQEADYLTGAANTMADASIVGLGDALAASATAFVDAWKGMTDDTATQARIMADRLDYAVRDLQEADYYGIYKFQNWMENGS